MSTKSQISSIIQFLASKNFWAECPSCQDSFKLKDAGLFALNEYTPEAEEVYQQMKADLAERRKEYLTLKKKGPERSGYTTEAVNIGKILERIAPAFDAFPFNRNDCRSLFDPIDYMIFEGLHKKGKVEKVYFVEIKTGAARLNKTQKQIKEAVGKKKVSFKQY